MDFKDFSKEARLKEEARINDLTNKVVAKATKMALDKFSRVYGITTKVAAQKTDLKEFKRNYLSGKIASVLSIDTKNGVKEVPFTILVKASEPSILESDVIMQDKIANTEGSLEKEINAILARQNQKLANFEVEEENNKKIIADLSKGISLEASRKEHIFKEAKKGKKEVGHNSLSTVTTPTNIFNKLVDYFTYPKTFFPPMKVGAIVDIGGVKYKYIGDEATMTEPAGNTNGTIARFELANKKKASLDLKAENSEHDLKYLELSNLLNEYAHNGLLSNITDIENKKVLTGSPDVINDLEHKVKDIGYYCDVVEEATGVEDEVPERSLRIYINDRVASSKIDINKKAYLENGEDITRDNFLNKMDEAFENVTNYDDALKIANDIANTYSYIKNLNGTLYFIDPTDNSVLVKFPWDLLEFGDTLNKTSAKEEKKIDFTDEELLDTDFSQLSEKGLTLWQLQKLLAKEYGYAKPDSLTNIIKNLKKNNKTKVRDLVEVAAGRVDRQKIKDKIKDGLEESITKKMSEEEKKDFFVEKDTDVLSLSESDAKEFYKNDAYVEENIKNWGLSPEDAAAFIDYRNYFNDGLPKNKVNDQLVEVAARDSEAAYSALFFLLRSGAKSAALDDPKIAEEYKVALFQSAANGDPDKNLKDFPQDIVEKYAYNEETFRIKEEEQNPIEETSDGYKTIIEEKVRAAIRGKSPEQIKEYCEKYKVIDTIKEELARLKEEINSYTKEQRAEVGTTFEEDEEETIEKEESLKVKAEPEDTTNKTDELEEGFEEEIEKAKEEFGGEAPVDQGKTVSDVEKEVVLKETTIPEKDDEEMEDILERTTKGVNSSEAVQTEIDSLRADYARYKTLKKILEKLEGALSKVNGENND